MIVKWYEMSVVVLHGNLFVILHFKKQAVLCLVSSFWPTGLLLPPCPLKGLINFVFYFSDWENVVETLYNSLITGTNDPSTTQDPGPLCDANNHQFGPYFATYIKDIWQVTLFLPAGSTSLNHGFIHTQFFHLKLDVYVGSVGNVIIMICGLFSLAVLLGNNR